MAENTSLEILKHAIILEKRGKNFYRTVAEQTDNDAVKTFFSAMAKEEVLHLQVLSEQYKACANGKPFNPHTDTTGPDVASAVMTVEILDKIQAADFEAAAISAAIAMEERAVNLYAKRATEAEDPEEKALYQWLADWEREHLRLLMEMDRTLLNNVWNDNNFWPF